MLELFTRLFKRYYIDKIEVVIENKKLLVKICTKVLSILHFYELKRIMKEEGYSFSGITVEGNYFRVVFQSCILEKT